MQDSTYRTKREGFEEAREMINKNVRQGGAESADYSHLPPAGGKIIWTVRTLHIPGYLHPYPPFCGIIIIVGIE